MGRPKGSTSLVKVYCYKVYNPRTKVWNTLTTELNPERIEILSPQPNGGYKEVTEFKSKWIKR